MRTHAREGETGAGKPATDEMQALRAELEHYKTEKEQIRDIVG